MRKTGKTSPRRKVIFTMIIFGMLVAAAGFLEAVFRMAGHPPPLYESVYDRFVTDKKVFSIVQNSGDGRRYYHCDMGFMVAGDFPVQKADKTFRVFVLGGSAALGWPHSPEYSCAAYLEKILNRYSKSGKFHVINAAGNAYASFRVRHVFDEIIEMDPDLVIIYSGNNEFLESRVYPPLEGFRAYLLKYRRILNASYTFRWFAAMLKPAFRAIKPAQLCLSADISREILARSRLSFAMGTPSPMKQDDRQFLSALNHYEFNLASMAQSAREHGVPLVLCTVPVNLQDWKPNVSVHTPGLPPRRLRQWKAFYREALEKRDAGEPDKALELFRSAETIDPAFAELHFEMGKTLLAMHDTSAARIAFEKALRLDAYPFRCLPEMQEIIRKTARKYSVTLADLVRALEETTPSGIIGNNLLVDYVHPKMSTNYRIAEYLSEVIMRDVFPQVDFRETPAGPPPDIPSEDDVKIAVLSAIMSQNLIMHQFDRCLAIAGKLIPRIEAQLAASPNPRRKKRLRLHLKRIHLAQRIIGNYQKLEKEMLFGIDSGLSDAEKKRVEKEFQDFIRYYEDPQCSGEFKRAFRKKYHLE